MLTSQIPGSRQRETETGPGVVFLYHSPHTQIRSQLLPKHSVLEMDIQIHEPMGKPSHTTIIVATELS